MSLQDKRGERREQKRKKVNYLRRTAIRISFPEMKDEVFINLLGYKEPNLVHLLRCKVSRYDDEEEEDCDDCSKFGDYGDRNRDDRIDNVTRRCKVSRDDDGEEEDGDDFSKFGAYDDSGRDDCNDNVTRSPPT